MSFLQTMKQKRGNRLDELQKKIASDDKGYTDPEADNYWRPTQDKLGNGFAIIRFLPSRDANGDENDPYVKFWRIAFQDPSTKQWYIENCLNSIGKPDPVVEYNSELWKTEIKANKDIASRQKRKTTYESNVLIIEDPGKPENEGKVFKFRYGQKILDKLKDKMDPKFPGEVAMNPFDLWEGANFKLKIVKVEGFPNYDKSEFEAPSALYDGDEAALEALCGKLFNVAEILDPSKYKSYEELEKRFLQVIGKGPTKGSSSGMSAEDMADALDEKVDEAKAPPPKAKEAEKKAEEKPKPVKEVKPEIADEDDDDLAAFARLAAEIEGN